MSVLSSPLASEDDSSLASSPGGSMFLELRLQGSQRNMRIEIRSCSSNGVDAGGQQIETGK